MRRPHPGEGACKPEAAGAECKAADIHGAIDIFSFVAACDDEVRGTGGNAQEAGRAGNGLPHSLKIEAGTSLSNSARNSESRS